MGRTRVRDIMSEKMVTISESDTLSTVEDIMTLGRVRHMPVVHAGKLVGVVSERDLLRISLSNLTEFGNEERRLFLHAVEIARVMSAPPIYIASQGTIQETLQLMAERHIRHLPISDDGETVLGVLSIRNVLHSLLDDIEKHAHHLEAYVGSGLAQ